MHTEKCAIPGVGPWGGGTSRACGELFWTSSEPCHNQTRKEEDHFYDVQNVMYNICVKYLELNILYIIIIIIM